jgi:Zn-dependent M16 (insulinase) family peptidase
MELEKITLFIDTENERERAAQLQELENSIRAQDKDSLVKEYKREKDENSTQDSGTLLVALLSALAASVLARGIADYYRKKGAKTVKIKIGYEIPADTPEKLAGQITRMMRR